MKNQSKVSYTPGPWHVGMRPGPMVYGKLGEQIADCRGLDESGYNAKVIAAVPQLVEALKDIANMSKGWESAIAKTALKAVGIGE